VLSFPPSVLSLSENCIVIETNREFLPFALPDIDETELEQVREVLESGWLTTGPKTQEFEEAFASYLHVKHAIAVNSCTAAMHLALEAIGVGQNHLIITSPYTFAATAEVIRYFDASPLFVDVQPGTLNMDVDQLEAALERIRKNEGSTERIRGMIPVHIAGHACDMDRICELAEHYKIPIIQDAAHSFPARYRGRLIGEGLPVKVPNFSCFSFYATKTITTGEGGMITTENDDLAERCRVMSLHGISKDAWKRYTAEGSWYYEIIAPGYKYNLTDLAAALGVAQLRKADQMLARRRQIAAQYNAGFAEIPELEVPTSNPDVEHAWHLYILRLNTERFRSSKPIRNILIEELKQLGIGCSVHFIPLHIHPYYKNTYGYAPQDFPVSFREYQRCISLPIYSRMTDQDVEAVIAAVRSILQKYIHLSG
jgi:dTDP-4-amino-4,6-dideoxygalactose transaminase